MTNTYFAFIAVALLIAAFFITDRIMGPYGPCHAGKIVSKAWEPEESKLETVFDPSTGMTTLTTRTYPARFIIEAYSPYNGSSVARYVSRSEWDSYGLGDRIWLVQKRGRWTGKLWRTEIERRE